MDTTGCCWHLNIIHFLNVCSLILRWNSKSLFDYIFDAVYEWLKMHIFSSRFFASPLIWFPFTSCIDASRERWTGNYQKQKNIKNTFLCAKEKCALTSVWVFYCCFCLVVLVTLFSCFLVLQTQQKWENISPAG